MFASGVSKARTKGSSATTEPLGRVLTPTARGRPGLGNQATLRSLSRGIQAKLEVGDVDDPLEHEADRAADQVMAMSDPDLALSGAPQPVQRKCAACEDEEATSVVQAKSTAASSVDGGAPGIVSQVLAQSGAPLDPGARAFFEPRFGQDFSGVRIHADGEAAQSARAINARAYTLGRHVVFGEGQFAPDGAEGRRLLAHELAHVVQQAGGARRVRRDVSASEWRDLARAKTPWAQWTQAQKEQAEIDHHNAVTHFFQDKAGSPSYEEARQVLELLGPYSDDMRAFGELATSTWLDVPTTATMVGNFQYEMPAGQSLDLKGRVTQHKSGTGLLVGDLLFEIFKDQLRQVDLRRVGLTACPPPQSQPCGAASYVTPKLTTGKYVLKATYQPLNSGNRSSYTEVLLTVT